MINVLNWSRRRREKFKMKKEELKCYLLENLKKTKSLQIKTLHFWNQKMQMTKGRKSNSEVIIMIWSLYLINYYFPLKLLKFSSNLCTLNQWSIIDNIKIMEILVQLSGTSVFLCKIPMRDFRELKMYSKLAKETFIRYIYRIILSLSETGEITEEMVMKTIMH